MRRKFLLMLALVALLNLMCSKDENPPTTPTPGGDDTTVPTSFALEKHLVTTEVPNSVTTLFQVTDLNDKGIDFLTIDRFQIEEEGKRLNNSEVSAYLLNKADINYTVRTKMLIDNNVGTNLDALKKGALQVIQNLDFQQEVAVYTISDKLELVLDYTSDVNALTGAINGIAEGGVKSNLYGGIMEAKRDRDEYELAGVLQHTYIIFTDSNDEVGSVSQDAIGPLTSLVMIYTIGYGGVDASKLDDIGVAYFGAADEAGILSTATKVQAEIVKYASSFYRLSYRSALRGGSGHSLKLTVSGNTNTEKSAYIEDNFSSASFVDVNDGLYVNWSYATTKGIDVVMVQVGTSRMVTLLSIGGSKQSNFSASSNNSNVATATVGTGDLLTVTAYGADGDSTTVTVTDVANNLSKVLTVKVVRFAIGSVLFEKWTGLTNASLSGLQNDKRYPDSPSNSELVFTWQIPTDISDNYGTRFRGYLYPLASGNYIFWISSDDQSQLFLSKDDNPANMKKVCEVASWTGALEWGKEKNQKSAAIALKAGKRYYIESIHVEGTGGDNLAVAWQDEDAAQRVLLTGDYLSPWEK